ncbi:MAG TPA: hypothetical protein VFE24_00875 [Pirellulales bacterium]|nr:hypothetical protein [Pirellulales bacterium]
MIDQHDVAARNELVSEFETHERRPDGIKVVASLFEGLSQLRDTLYTRIHDDVELAVGTDSMLFPLSESSSHMAANTEIELYQIAETCFFAVESDLVSEQGGWFVEWLTKLRLGESANAKMKERVQSYLAKTPSERRRAFARNLQQVFPEAGQAPLVLYRLFPLAIGVATAIGFGDNYRAAEIRKEQVRWLPSIGDCHVCHGRLFENGERCTQCGNPFWDYDWLVAE